MHKNIKKAAIIESVDDDNSKSVNGDITESVVDDIS